MSNPLLSIVIPTYNRPDLLPRAVKSALEQTLEDVEVIVVDDASPEPVQLLEHPRLQILRQPVNSGGAAARNVGARAARGHWLAYLDDDDELLPHMAEVSLEALAKTTLPKPVAAISGIEVVNADGKVIETRLPPTLLCGSHFGLEEIQPGQSFLCKQTMVVEREVFLKIGGFDESFPSRIHTELFLRLNQVCSILGLPIVTYQLFAHEESRVSRNPSLRSVAFESLVRKHESLFKAHPKMFAELVYKNAVRLNELGQKRAAFSSIWWAMQIDPLHIVPQVASQFRGRMRGYALRLLAKLSFGKRS